MANQAFNPGEDRFIVSSCLAGLDTRYDGGNKLCEPVKKLVEQAIAVPFCPEQGGGLATPRPPAEITGGDGHDVLAGRARVLTREGKDVTQEFIRGAREMLRLAQTIGAGKAILKSLSPSCGHKAIYDGTFSGKIITGDGVTSALLKESGIEVITEEELDD